MEPAAKRRVESPRPTVGIVRFHRNDSVRQNPVIKIRVLIQTDNHNWDLLMYRFL